MTKRLWTITTYAILTGSAVARAQSAAPDPRETLASQYLNAESGVTLAEAITRALAQEPTLRATRTALDAASGERVQADLRPNPTVAFMQQLEPGGTDSQTRIEMQWPLELFRKSGRVAVAEQGRQAIQFGVADRERLLAGDVRMKYGEVVAAVRDLSVSDELLATATRQVELLRARVDQGAIPPLERNIVEVELHRLEAERFLQVGQVDRAVIELKRLLGMPATVPLQLRDSLEQLALGELDMPRRASSTVPVARPDVREAEAQIRVAEARVDSAQRDGRYDLSLTGSYTRMDAGFPQFGFDNRGQLTPVRDVFHYLSVGVTITLPWRTQNEGQVAVAQAERTGAMARLAAAQLTAESEIAAATARDERARSAVGIYRSGARDLARQNVDVVNQTYTLGRATVFDVLAEQRRYLEVERGYSRALREAFEARTALRRALGDVR
jgi:outer membrane protein, heavy metal efflux system